MKPVLDYGSGDNDLDSGLDILLQDQKVIEMEKPKPKHAKSQGLVWTLRNQSNHNTILTNPKPTQTLFPLKLGFTDKNDTEIE